MLENLKPHHFSNPDSLKVSRRLLECFKKRRSVRHFTPSQVDEEIILNAIRVAGLSPSGANKQPWSFALISDHQTKQMIKEKAEHEEFEFYHKRAPKRWLKDLEHLHTNEKKNFLTQTDYLIPIFSRTYDISEDGTKEPHYYVKESVGIATGFLISALHLSGLSVLTYTPSKMSFLTKLLERPENEKIFMLLVVGVSHPEAQVPKVEKKTLDEILTIFRGKKRDH